MTGTELGLTAPHSLSLGQGAASSTDPRTQPLPTSHLSHLPVGFQIDLKGQDGMSIRPQ